MPRIRVTVDRKAVKIGGLWPPTLFSQRSIGLEAIAIRLFLRFNGTLCAANVSRGHSEFFTRLHGWFSFTRVNHEFQSGQKEDWGTRWNVEWVRVTRFLCINLHGGNWKEAFFEFFNGLIFHCWKVENYCLVHLMVFWYGIRVLDGKCEHVEWNLNGLLLLFVEFKNSGQNWASWRWAFE